jgi:uncharacterized protein (TIGR02145 family)
MLFAIAHLTSIQAQFTCGDTLLDVRDGQYYLTVLIGTDCWFKQNLNYGNMVVSDSTGTPHSNVSNNSIPEKYVQYNNIANASILGGLYDGQELMEYVITTGGQGLCPAGWHVSTDAEWANLITNAGANMVTASGGNGGNKLKKIGVGVATGIGTDDVGFSALMGGDRDSYGIFYGMNQRAIFWTSTLASPTTLYHYTLWVENDTIERLTNPPSPTAFSCRCVLNSGTGINNFENDLDILTFPNPAKTFINVQATNYSKPIKYSILNATGQIIKTGTINGSITTVDISDISDGIYLLRFTDSSLKSEKKLIISK